MTKKKKKSKRLSFTPEWVAVFVAGLSLLLSVGNFVLDYSDRKSLFDERTLDTIDKFITNARLAKEATSCFKAANKLNDEQINLLFQENEKPMSIVSSPELLQCIQKPQSGKFVKLSDKDIDKIRATIVFKLNDYDRVFSVITAKTGDQNQLCDTVWSSFKDGAYGFMKRIRSMTETPYIFKGYEVTLKNTVSAMDQEYCSN